MKTTLTAEQKQAVASLLLCLTHKPTSEAWLRILVWESAKDELFDLAADYLLDAGLANVTIVQAGGKFGPALFIGSGL